MSHHAHGHAHGHASSPTATLIEEHDLILQALDALAMRLDAEQHETRVNTEDRAHTEAGRR